MSAKNIIDGLQILSNYYDDQEEYYAMSANDCIVADATDWPMTSFDVVKMINLGWFQQYKGSQYGKFKGNEYRHNQQWMYSYKKS